MKISVKFCPSNFEDELETMKDKLMECSGLEVIEDRCLLYCGQCLMQPFAVVNGVNIVANDPVELLEKIEEYVARLKQGDTV
ncbi:DUF1450 domain-containing protein [Peribacillus butanolivorans]|uniref:DUF1450 domain-containing protein n=1 Tax=Peribacillus butanolivorans TaxID=421767 RepID=UPI0006A70856|nr:DUF1450 domain-containing protein [Peribacillus butanolivorans]KON68052.1 hypothetical protein AKG34_03955 [Peribacillus butanolivorans]MCO0599076.1 YuzB family protein [Peribacillus butanolivorans]